MSHLGRCEKRILQNFEITTKIWWKHVQYCIQHMYVVHADIGAQANSYRNRTIHT